MDVTVDNLPEDFLGDFFPRDIFLNTELIIDNPIKTSIHETI